MLLCCKFTLLCYNNRIVYLKQISYQKNLPQKENANFKLHTCNYL